MCKSAKPKQIGTREEVINGQRVKVRIFEPRMPVEPVEEPIQARDDSDMPWQNMFRRTRESAAW
jgi:hypothetical protein